MPKSVSIQNKDVIKACLSVVGSNSDGVSVLSRNVSQDQGMDRGLQGEVHRATVASCALRADIYDSLVAFEVAVQVSIVRSAPLNHQRRLVDGT